MKKSIFLILFMVLSFSKSGYADAPHIPTKDELDTTYDLFLHKMGELGPTSQDLHKEAILDLPSGYTFIGPDNGRKMMEKIGNKMDDHFLGLIVPSRRAPWYVVIEFIDSGYIKDDDAKNWDTDKLLNQIRSNTEEQNKERIDKGLKALDIIGWIEKPHYDSSDHSLVWSVAAHDQSNMDGDNTINYVAMTLGREGYISLTMVTGEKELQEQKPAVKLLLSKLRFNAGKSYGDFNATTDRVAAYGLAALVAGIAAKKLGLIAILVALGAKFVKAGLLAIAALLATWKSRLNKKKRASLSALVDQKQAPPSDPPGPSA